MLMLILFISSCSVVMVKRLDNKVGDIKDTSSRYDCTSSYLLPGIDTFFILGGGFALGPLGVIPFVGSAAYGYYNVYSCKKYDTIDDLNDDEKKP